MSNRQRIQELVNQIGILVSKERWLADEAVKMLREEVYGPARLEHVHAKECGLSSEPARR